MDRTTEPNSISRAWHRHPIVKGLVGVAAFVVVAEVAVMFIPPAWAAVAIPITERITIDLGEMPQWIIALVAAGGLWKAWRAERVAREIKTDLIAVKQDVALVERNTNSMTTTIAALAQEKGVGIGEKKAEAQGVAAAHQLAEGQRQGIEMERASVTAAKSAAAPAPIQPADDKAPLPVADNRTATASERVAAATERSADAQQRVADVSEKDKPA